VKDIIAKGEKLAAEPKAPEFLAKVKNKEIKSFLDSKYFSACLVTTETLFLTDLHGVRLNFNVQKLTEMKDLWAKTSNAAKDRLKDLKVKKQLRIFRVLGNCPFNTVTVLYRATLQPGTHLLTSALS
jgi:hypothetical protein